MVGAPSESEAWRLQPGADSVSGLPVPVLRGCQCHWQWAFAPGGPEKSGPGLLSSRPGSEKGEPAISGPLFTEDGGGCRSRRPRAGRWQRCARGALRKPRAERGALPLQERRPHRRKTQARSPAGQVCHSAEIRRGPCQDARGSKVVCRIARLAPDARPPPGRRRRRDATAWQ